jgi:peroxiredoxin
MQQRISYTFILAALLSMGILFANEAEVDAQAPAFTLVDSEGTEHSLSDFKGKYVVLEWINYGCPFVKKHYDSGNMQALQGKYTGKDVVWLAICSSAEGKQGYYSGSELSQQIAAHKGKQTAYLIDADGKVGKLYGAQTTPHMYVVDPEGKLIYMGGIDDKRSTDVADVETATNYVSAVLDAALAGEEIPYTSTRPYGCSVKYK